jgi:hypothetical protein
MNDMVIEKLSNGYLIATGITRRREVYKTIEEVLRQVMFDMESKCESFGGNSYAKITVNYTAPTGREAK